MRPWALCVLVLVFLQATSASSSRSVVNREPVTIDLEKTSGEVEVVIQRGFGSVDVSCEIQTPEGSLYELTDDFEHPGIRIIPSNLAISCGVAITASADLLGRWTLIANENDLFTGPLQTRIPIVVHEGLIEEIFEIASTTSAPGDVVIDLPIRTIGIEDVSEEIEIHIPRKMYHRTDKCEIRTPDGDVYELTEETDLNGIRSTGNLLTNMDISCGVVVRVSENVLGEWVLIAKETNWFNDSTVDTMLPIVFQEVRVPESTTTEGSPSTEVNTLEGKIIRTEIGETFEVTIKRGFDHDTEECQILTPDGTSHDLGADIPGVQKLDTRESCSVKVTVQSEDLLGQWMLIAKEYKLFSGTYVDTRLPFEVIVERTAQATPQNSTSLRESSDFHIRLMEPTDMYQTCRLVPPNEQALNRIQIDQSATNVCAYIVRKVAEEDSGIWTIVYGNTVQYKASVELVVTGRTDPATSTQIIHLIRNAAVNMEVGPEDAVYCRMEDPNGVVVFDGFGRCVLSNDRVPSWYNGQWTINVGLPGKVIAETHLLNVRIIEPESRPEVQMSLAMSHSDRALTVSCSVETSSSPRACKFRDPQGRILVAQQGVGEDRYSFYGAGISSISGKYVMDCGLKISSPGVEDLGIWRCGVETEDDTRYGFLLVVCPWLMRNETIAATVKTEPVLRAAEHSSVVTSGDGVEMSCTIPSLIRYCYFRSDNGTVLTVSPGVSNDVYEYVGSGFEAGECGIRLKELSMSDIGTWSCNVGLNNGSLSEQSAFIHLYGSERMSARLNLQRDQSAIITARVGMDVEIEYCRFVRSDGFGFTNELVPEGYVFTGVLLSRECDLHIVRPRDVDVRPWIVATRIKGQDHEIIARTQSLENNLFYPYSHFLMIRLTLICICISLFCLSLGLLFSSKKSRRWTYARATAVRDSFRRSFRKAPPLEDKTTATSPQAA